MYIELLYFIIKSVYIYNILTCLYTFSNYMKLYVIKHLLHINSIYKCGEHHNFKINSYSRDVKI